MGSVALALVMFFSTISVVRMGCTCNARFETITCNGDFSVYSMSTMGCQAKFVEVDSNDPDVGYICQLANRYKFHVTTDKCELIDSCCNLISSSCCTGTEVITTKGGSTEGRKSNPTESPNTAAAIINFKVVISLSVVIPAVAITAIAAVLVWYFKFKTTAGPLPQPLDESAASPRGLVQPDDSFSVSNPAFLNQAGMSTPRRSGRSNAGVPGERFQAA